MSLGDQCSMPWEMAARERLRQDGLPRLRPGLSLSVMFPAYNDAETIGKLVDYSAELLPRIAEDYEIVVVNDGSPDHTAQVLAERAERYPFLKVVSHPVNRGYGAALRSGFEAATKELLFYTDGDGQYDPTELVVLLPHIEGCGMVNGFKIKRGDSWTRVVVGRLYHWTAKLMFGLVVRDVDCDFRLIRRDVLQSIHLTSAKGSICAELVRKIQDQGALIRQVPVHHFERVSGRSQFFQFRRVVPSLLMLVRLWHELVCVPTVRRPMRYLLSFGRVRGRSRN
jgi:glycosyltransferase involved in cell wall biosynthesis